MSLSFPIFLIRKLLFFSLRLLIQHLPVIIGTGILLRFVFSFDGKRNGSGGDDAIGGGKKKSLNRPHSVRRRTLNRERRDTAQNHNQDNDQTQPLSSIIHKELLGELNALEECKKELQVFRHSQSYKESLGNIAKDRNQEKMRGPEDEVREDGKSIEHEVSETERYKRLESLIERREARKLRALGSEKHVISPICVSKPSDGLPLEATNEGLPGSAPPIRSGQLNPFDIPYDPLEEKPDLSDVPRHKLQLDENGRGRIIHHGLLEGGSMSNAETNSMDDRVGESNGSCVVAVTSQESEKSLV